LDKANATLGKDFKDKVLARVVSRELNVRQILAKVSLGEADAAFAYRTDAMAGGDKVKLVTIPPDTNVIAEYPIAVLKTAPQPARSSISSFPPRGKSGSPRPASPPAARPRPSDPTAAPPRRHRVRVVGVRARRHAARLPRHPRRRAVRDQRPQGVDRRAGQP